MRGLNSILYERLWWVCDADDFSMQTVNVSKRLALMRGVLKRQDGALVSTCEHQMYNVDADAVKL